MPGPVSGRATKKALAFDEGFQDQDCRKAHWQLHRLQVLAGHLELADRVEQDAHVRAKLHRRDVVQRIAGKLQGHFVSEARLTQSEF